MKWIKVKKNNLLIQLDYVRDIKTENDIGNDEYLLNFYTDDRNYNIAYDRKEWRDRDFLEICKVLEDGDNSIAYLTGNKMNVD